MLEGGGVETPKKTGHLLLFSMKFYRYCLNPAHREGVLKIPIFVGRMGGP